MPPPAEDVPDEEQPKNGKHWNKRSVRNKSIVVSFNEDDRREFITGFHKRKKQRRKRAEKEKEKKERQKRIQERKQRRLALKMALGEVAGDVHPSSSEHVSSPKHYSEDSDAALKDDDTFIYEHEDATTIVRTCEINPEQHETVMPNVKHLSTDVSKMEIPLQSKGKKQFKRIKKSKQSRKGHSFKDKSSRKHRKKGK
eukprot:TRINITY_DN38296_c0_g1_i1.p1 TRINITY_DN38296_c0_g1~~TRINITY_DN38296_c0_g1_i1.p1  ORF type:complete len:198 (+),score=52.27 TRINITY_DN38296_c0_g1_i1:60-653(+)